MSDILDQIVAVKREEIAAAMRRKPLPAMRADAESRVLTRDFVGAMRRKIDAGNVYLWRMNRRKLEAEAIRDAVLQVAGKLDPKMGGPSFQDFVIDQPAHSPHYEYHLHDPNDPKSHRRSIYRFIVRSQPQPPPKPSIFQNPPSPKTRSQEVQNSISFIINPDYPNRPNLLDSPY